MSESSNAELGDHAAAADGPLPEGGFASVGFTAFVLAVGCVFFLQSSSIQSNAAVWPRTLSAVLILISGLRLAMLVFKLVRSGAAARESSRPAAPAGPAPLMENPVLRQVFTAAWLVGYCIVARYVGFGTAGAVFLPVYMYLFGFRKPLWIVVVTAAALAGYTVLFDTLANVPVWSNRL